MNTVGVADFLMPLDTAVTLGFYLVAAIYCIFSAILYYHWHKYTDDSKVARITLILYFALSTPLLIFMGVMTLII
jgi:hypothetical protein